MLKSWQNIDCSHCCPPPATELLRRAFMKILTSHLSNCWKIQRNGNQSQSQTNNKPKMPANWKCILMVKISHKFSLFLSLVIFIGKNWACSEITNSYNSNAITIGFELIREGRWKRRIALEIYIGHCTPNIHLWNGQNHTAAPLKHKWPETKKKMCKETNKMRW